MWSKIIAGACLVSAQAALPVTTNTYAYDARGRLKIACHAPEGAGYRTIYSLDKVDNRTNVWTQNEFFVIVGGSGITSADGRFYFTLQLDNNLVVYGPSGVIWTSGTNGSGATYAFFQQDGNLVLTTSSGTPVWSSGTNSHCANLTVQNDGNVVIFSATGAVVWATNTGGH